MRIDGDAILGEGCRSGGFRPVTALVTDGLEWWARATPDQPALIFDGSDAVDYATLARWSDGAARLLADSGLRRGVSPGPRSPH